MNSDSSIPPEWVAKDLTLVAAGTPQDIRHAGRLEAVGSDGCVLDEQGNQRFFPWHAVRWVKLGRE